MEVLLQMENTFNSSQKIGAIVAKFPKAGMFFQEYQIDYCCGGDRPLSVAIAEQNINETELIGKLNQAYEDFKTLGSNETDWWVASYDNLVDYIVNTHHVFLNNELPKLSDLTTKILRVHGPHHPELSKVHKLFHTLKLELDQHLIKEEQILFPLIMDYEDEPSLDNLNKILEVIEELEEEHVGAGDILKELRSVTKDYAIPGDVCSTFTLTYQKLHAMELDLFTHIHLENNILFPRLESQKYIGEI